MSHKTKLMLLLQKNVTHSLNRLNCFIEAVQTSTFDDAVLLILWLQSELRITLKSRFAFVPQHWQGVAQLWFFWGLGLAWFAFWWHFLSTSRAQPTVQQCLGIQLPRSSWALCKRFLWSNNGSLPNLFHNACYQDMQSVLSGFILIT